MARSPYCYRLRVDGHLGDHWSAWFGGLTLHHERDGTTNLSGPVSDQAELHGMLTRIRDLGVTLISVAVIDPADETGLWHPVGMQSVYESAGGHAGLLRLAEAWHCRVMADEVVSHAFSHGFHPQHTERLAAYWAEALGGPASYSDDVGDETSVVRMHSGNGRHEEMDQRAIACFDQALNDVGLDANEALRQVLHDYFGWATTTTMARYPDSADDVPEHLIVPRWSWDGPQV